MGFFNFKRNGCRKATPEDDARFAEAMEENNVGLKDKLAMVGSAFLVIVLPCLLILLAFAGLSLLFLYLAH